MDDDDRSSDTAETHGQQDLPGGSSNQNAEEEPTPSGDSGGEGRQDDQDTSSEDPGREDLSGDTGSEGGAGEGSQATGNPSGAG